MRQARNNACPLKNLHIVQAFNNKIFRSCHHNQFHSPIRFSFARHKSSNFTRIRKDISRKAEAIRPALKKARHVV